MPRKREIEAAIAAHNEADQGTLLPPDAVRLLTGLVQLQLSEAVNVAQVGAGQIDAVQVGAVQVGAGQVGEGQVGAARIRGSLASEHLLPSSGR